MASLYKRATPSQAYILRAVEGAVKNAQDAHPEIQISQRHRRSIAKRAAGTLTAQWPEVLAAKVMRQRPSEIDVLAEVGGCHRQSSKPVKAAGGAHVSSTTVRALLRFRWHIVRDMKRIAKEEHPEYLRAMQNVLRMLAEAGAVK